MHVLQGKGYEDNLKALTLFLKEKFRRHNFVELRGKTREWSGWVCTSTMVATIMGTVSGHILWVSRRESINLDVA